MSHFLAAYHTDIGVKKAANQDSISIQCALAAEGEALLAVLCDGMGGMDKGELASAEAARSFSEWFVKDFLARDCDQDVQEIMRSWEKLLADVNEKLIRYGSEKRERLGTTFTAILIFPQNDYLIGHVGDTRIYHIRDEMRQLTEDHTFVARELKKGRMTREQAAGDPRKNVLLQCIGVNSYIDPQFLRGRAEPGDGFLLCSDGFRHVVSEREMLELLKPDLIKNKRDAEKRLIKLTELNKRRKETDNISAVYIKAI